MCRRQLLFQLVIERFPVCIALTERPLNGSCFGVDLGRESEQDAFYQLEFRPTPRLRKRRNHRSDFLIRKKHRFIRLVNEYIAEFKPHLIHPCVRNLRPIIGE